MFSWERAGFKKKDDDDRFSQRESHKLKDMLKTIDKRYGRRVQRVFGRLGKAKKTYFPMRDLRTDQNAFVCHLRAHRWLEFLTTHQAGLQVMAIETEQDFQQFVRVCS